MTGDKNLTDDEVLHLEQLANSLHPATDYSASRLNPVLNKYLQTLQDPNKTAKDKIEATKEFIQVGGYQVGTDSTATDQVLDTARGLARFLTMQMRGPGMNDPLPQDHNQRALYQLSDANAKLRDKYNIPEKDGRNTPVAEIQTSNNATRTAPKP